MKKIATRLAVLVGAVAMVLGFSVPAQAQSATVCLSGSIVVNGQTIIELPGCTTLPPA